MYVRNLFENFIFFGQNFEFLQVLSILFMEIKQNKYEEDRISKKVPYIED